MASFNKFLCFVQDVGRKVHNLDSDTLKVALTNSAPVNTNTVLADITEIAASGGYSSGGATVPNNDYTQVAGVASLIGDAAVFTATGPFGPFRYAVIYNATAAGGPLIGWWDYGSSLSMDNGDTFKVKPSASLTGGTILTLT